MAKQIIDARIKQKTASFEEWNNNPLILLDGEVALVRTATGAIIQQRVGDGYKTFAELPDNIRYDQSAFIQVNAPSKVTGNYTVVGAGTYGGVTVGADKITVLYWNGTDWVKNFEGDLPKVDVVDGFASTDKTKAGSADNDRVLKNEINIINSKVVDQSYSSGDLKLGNCNNSVVGSVLTYGSLTDFNYNVFSCEEGQQISVKTLGGVNTSRGYAFCDSDLQVISVSIGGAIDSNVIAPTSCKYIAVNCLSSGLGTFSLKIKAKVQSQVDNNTNEITGLKKDTQALNATILDRSYSGDDLKAGLYNCNVVGTVATFGNSVSFFSNIFDCEENQIVHVDTLGGSNTARGYAFCDKDLKVLQFATGGAVKGNFKAPLGTKKIIINTNIDYKNNVEVIINSFVGGEIESLKTLKPSLEDIAPQILNNYVKRRDLSEPVKILFFGSSWLMNSYWYLNFMAKSVGINADISAFYAGGAPFSSWIDRYKNNTSLDCLKSSNGSNWTWNTVAFKDELKRGWDLIIFQQGYTYSLDYDNNWKPYLPELLSIVKRNCGVDTVIGFNSTFTPAVDGNLAPYPNTTEGQKKWQQDNYNSTKKFIVESGVNLISPVGATVWTMRNTTSINTANDLAPDKLHLDNGMPMYATGLTLFDTYLSPMYGVDIKDVPWVPTSETQKAIAVSGQGYTELTEENRLKIVDIVKLSRSNRFGFSLL